MKNIIKTDKKEIKIGFIIDNFQPFHKGHANLITETYAKCDHVIIFIKNSNRVRTIENPFTFEERRSIIFEFLLSSWGEERIHDFRIEKLSSYILDKDWLSFITKKILKIRLSFKNYTTVSLFTLNKEAEQMHFYFNDYCKINEVKEYNTSEVKLRKMYFLSSGSNGYIHKKDLPADTISFLEIFRNKKDFFILKEKYEKELIENSVSNYNYLENMKTHLIIVLKNNKNNKVFLIEKENEIYTLNKKSTKNLTRDTSELLQNVDDGTVIVDFKDFNFVQTINFVIKDYVKLTGLKKINFVEVFYINNEREMSSVFQGNLKPISLTDLQKNISKITEETFVILKGIFNE